MRVDLKRSVTKRVAACGAHARWRLLNSSAFDQIRRLALSAGSCNCSLVAGKTIAPSSDRSLLRTQIGPSMLSHGRSCGVLGVPIGHERLGTCAACRADTCACVRGTACNPPYVRRLTGPPPLIRGCNRYSRSFSIESRVQCRQSRSCVAGSSAGGRRKPLLRAALSQGGGPTQRQAGSITDPLTPGDPFQLREMLLGQP